MIPKITGFGHNVQRKLHYDYFGSYYGKNIVTPHSTAYGYSHRNLLQYGINCRAGNYLATLHDFKRFKPSHHIKNKTLNIVLGFRNDEINCHKTADRIRAINLGRKFVKLAFGKNSQALISLQHDAHEPHLHITVNNVNIKTLHAIPAKQRNLSRLEAIDTDMIKVNNKQNPDHLLINPFHHRFQSEIQHTKENERTDVSDNTKHSLGYRVRMDFIHALNQSRNSSKTKIRRFMRNNYHIRVKFIRPNKRRNKRHRRRHNHYGIVFVPFTITKNNRRKSMHSVKASSIGINYRSVMKQLRRNRSLLKQQQRQANAEAKAKRKALNVKRKQAKNKLWQAVQAVNDDKGDRMDMAKFDLKDYINLENVKATAKEVLSNKEIQVITHSKPKSVPKVKATKPVNKAKINSKSKPKHTKIQFMPTVDNTMTRLNEPAAQEDFGTELDMQQQAPNDIPKATHQIRHHYQLRQQHARIIDNYMIRANRYNAHHHISIFKRAVSKAKSWLRRKHLQFRYWIHKITKPKKSFKDDEHVVGSPQFIREVESTVKKPPKSTKTYSDNRSIYQQRAFNRNRLKRIQERRNKQK